MNATTNELPRNELSKTHLVTSKTAAVSENQVIIDELLDVIATKLFGHCSAVGSLTPKKDGLGFFGIIDESLENTFNSQSATIEKLREINDML